MKTPYLKGLLYASLAIMSFTPPIIVASTYAGPYVADQINIYINDQHVLLPLTPPVQIDDTVLVPIREVFETLGATVLWDDDERKAYIDYKETSVVLEDDSQVALVNGRYVPLGMPLTIINDKVMVPVRFIAEQMDCDVQWHNAERTVSITTTDAVVYANGEKRDPTENDYAYANLAYTVSAQLSNNTSVGNSGGESSIGHEIDLIEQSDTTTVAPSPNATYADIANLTYDNATNTVQIGLPSGVTASNITITDAYRDKLLIIDLGGDYSHIYSPTIKQLSDDAVDYIEVSTTGGTTKFIIRENTIYTYDMHIQDNTLHFKLLRPQEKYDKIVLLDSGHGGIDSGAVNSSGMMEKDVNMAQTLAVKQLLESQTDIKVYLSREDDIYSTLRDRTDLANEIDVDLFISIHNNSSEYSSANGAEVYYYPGSLEGQVLAEGILNRIVNYTGIWDRGVKGADNYVVLKTSAMTAVLVEAGFLSHSSDAAKLASTDFTNKYAQAVVDAIVEYFNTMPY